MMNLLKKHKVTIILAVILIVAAFLRLYKISEYMTFLGDEGRDVLVVKHIIEGDLTFLGPRASAGDFYLGPIYYYFMAPFLFLFRYDPVGPAVMIALAGVLTTYLIYRFGKTVHSTLTGLMAATLFAISPLVLSFSRSSWNPHAMPLVTLGIFYFLYKAIKKPTWKYLLSVGVLYGVAIQLHYIEVFVAPCIALSIIIGRLLVTKKIEIKETIKAYLIVLGGFVIGISPFLAFEIKNGFPNTRTIFSFIFDTNVSTEGVRAPFFTIVGDVFFRVFGRLITWYPAQDALYKYNETILFIWGGITFLLAALSIFTLFKLKDKVAVLLFSLWLFFGVVLFGFYKKEIYDYYFEFMLPVPFILVGILLATPWVKKMSKLWRGVSAIIFVGLIGVLLSGMPFQYEPNNQKTQIKTISEFVISKTDNKPYNFALLTPGNSDHGYRYYFEILGHEPVIIENPIKDPERKSVTDQLLIVCEDTSCQPLGNPLFEVAGFGRAEIAGEWDVSVVKVFKLVPYSGNE